MGVSLSSKVIYKAPLPCVFVFVDKLCICHSLSGDLSLTLIQCPAALGTELCLFGIGWEVKTSPSCLFDGRTSMKQLPSVTLSYNKEDKKWVHSCLTAVGQAGAACSTWVLLTSPAASNAAEKQKPAFMIVSIINGRWYRSGELWSPCFLWNFCLEKFRRFLLRSG